MTIPKKSSQDFLTEVILPIEKRESDNQNLHVFIEASPELIPGDPGYRQYEELDFLEWAPFPSASTPGEWREAGKQKHQYQKIFKLLSLSGVIWHGSKGGMLYNAEYEGDAERLTLYDFFSFSRIQSDEQKMEIKAQEDIDNRIFLGIKVRRARLTSKVKKWTPYLAWSFALDCVEHACNSLNSESILDTYRKGIIFARAYAKSRCSLGDLELERLLGVTANEQGFYSAAENMKQDLEREILVQKEQDFSTRFLADTILESFSVYKPFVVTTHARTQVAWTLQGKYRNEYQYPSYLKAKGVEEEALVKRIWYALMKGELDWQVTHLKEMLREEKSSNL